MLAPFVRGPLNARIFLGFFCILKQFVEWKNLMLKIHAHVFCISKIRMHFFAILFARKIAKLFHRFLKEMKKIVRNRLALFALKFIGAFKNAISFLK